MRSLRAQPKRAEPGACGAAQRRRARAEGAERAGPGREWTAGFEWT